MGRRGPPKEPTALRLLKGNPSRRPVPEGEPKPEAKAPSCPSWLGREGKREWKRLAGELERLGLLTMVDRGVMAGYCQAYHRWYEAEGDLRRFRRDRKAMEDYTKVRLATTSARNERKAMLLFARELGLTPAARAGLLVAEVAGELEKPGELEAFLTRRQRGKGA